MEAVSTGCSLFFIGSSRLNTYLIDGFNFHQPYGGEILVENQFIL
jgi:hypothetical protein